MKLYEYQVKEIFAKYGINIQKGKLVGKKIFLPPMFQTAPNFWFLPPLIEEQPM